MRERVKIVTKKHEAKLKNTASQTRKPARSQSLNSPVDRILFLQRTIGNRAVEGLFKSGVIQAKLNIGQPGDKYEQEADRVAEQFMRMPEPRSLAGRFSDYHSSPRRSNSPKEDFQSITRSL